MHFTSSHPTLQSCENYISAFIIVILKHVSMCTTKEKPENCTTLNELIIVWSICLEEIQAIIFFNKFREIDTNKWNVILKITLMKKHQTDFALLSVWKNQYKCYLLKKSN
jgi:hypothetical protein